MVHTFTLDNLERDNPEQDNLGRVVPGNPVLGNRERVVLGNRERVVVHSQERALHRLLDMELGTHNSVVEGEGQERQHSPWHSEAERGHHRRVVTRHKQGLVEEPGTGMRKGEEHRELLPSLLPHVPFEHRLRQNLGQMMVLVRSQRKEYGRSRLRV